MAHTESPECDQKGRDFTLERAQEQNIGSAAATPIPVSHPSLAPTHQLQAKSSSAGAVFALSCPPCLEVREGEEQPQTVQQPTLEFARCSTDITRRQIRGTLQRRLLVPDGLPFRERSWGVKSEGVLSHLIIQA